MLGGEQWEDGSCSVVVLQAAAQRRERGGYVQTALLTENMKTKRDFRRKKKILQMSRQHVWHTLHYMLRLDLVLGTILFWFSVVRRGEWYLVSFQSRFQVSWADIISGKREREEKVKTLQVTDQSVELSLTFCTATAVCNQSFIYSLNLYFRNRLPISADVLFWLSSSHIRAAANLSS